LGGVQRLGKERIGIGLAQRSEPGFGITRANLAPIEREGPAEPLDQRRGKRTVVILQLRQVGGADRQSRGQLRLLEAMLGPDRPKARSGEEAARRHSAVVVCKLTLRNFANSHWTLLPSRSIPKPCRSPRGHNVREYR